MVVFKLMGKKAQAHLLPHRFRLTINVTYPQCQEAYRKKTEGEEVCAYSSPDKPCYPDAQSMAPQRALLYGAQDAVRSS